MIENYMNLNDVWTPVLIITNGTIVTNNIVINGNVQYNVVHLRDNIYIIKSKTIITIPDDVKAQIETLLSDNTQLGKQVCTLILSNAKKSDQITTLGKQVTALILKGGIAV